MIGSLICWLVVYFTLKQITSKFYLLNLNYYYYYYYYYYACDECGFSKEHPFTFQAATDLSQIHNLMLVQY